MKHFFRTIAGKTTLFLTLTLTLALFCIGSLGTFFTLYHFGDQVYRTDKDTLYQQLYEDYLFSVAHNYLNFAMVETYEHNNDVHLPQDENVFIRIYHKNTLAFASGSAPSFQPDFQQEFVVIRDAWGNYFNIYKPEEISYSESDGMEYTVQLQVKEAAPIKQDFQVLKKLLPVIYALRYWIYVILTALLLLVILCFISLMCVAGRRKGTEELFPGVANKIPTDLLLLFVPSTLLAILMLLMDALSFSGIYDEIVCILCIPLLSPFLIWMCMNIAVRIKEKTFFKNTFLYFCCHHAKRFMKALGSLFLYLLKQIPFLWKGLLAIFLIMFIHFLALFLFYYEMDSLIIFTVLETIILFPASLYALSCLWKLHEGALALAKGQQTKKLDTKYMIADLKKHGDALNNIGAGIQIAVEERLKSERMKTELITNVSHDIKTPLTSIINYADLIKKEPHENEKIEEYCTVLIRQSDRLKRLLEDLVEASKASTGNLEVNLSPCNVSVLVEQACGEYQEKLSSAALELFVKVPEEELVILADGRRMWRIFDNLMNNICKYSLPYTRVYLDVKKEQNQVIISLKNISKNPLNVSEEELMERFTRGDSSRSTEGNGLGLSIARSLAELQKGSLSVQIDGDLFKAILRFPLQ